MSIALLIAAALQATPAAGSGYPAAEVYAAFAQGCAEVGDLAKARTALTAAGWQAYEPAPGSPADKLVKLGTDALRGNAGIKVRPGATFRRTVAGEQLDLILSGIESDGAWINGCRVYDFGETRELPIALVTQRLGREPTVATTHAGLLNKAEWNPGLRADHLSAELYFVPSDSPAAALLGSTGVCLVAQATGTLK